MATYLPNVKDYVPQTETFTPDFKFLNDVLSIRQDRYDSNYQQMNNLYGSVVHADVSREDSKAVRDQYTDLLIPKMKQIAGLDLSLQQNVDAAKGLFAPFYENKELVRDMVYTKRGKGQMAMGEKMKTSNDEATRKLAWDGAIQKLNYDMEDFINASAEDMMTMALPSYVKRYDFMTEGLAKIKELDPDVEHVSFSADGVWKITQTNGALLRRLPAGKDAEGNVAYTDPVGDYLSASLLNDPRAIEYFQTKAYVESRSFYDKNKEQYGDKQEGMNAWGDQFLAKFETKEDAVIADLELKEQAASDIKESWANHVKRFGVLAGSDSEQAIKDADATHKALSTAGEIRRKRKADQPTGPSANLTKAYNLYMSIAMMQEINGVANAYASTHGKIKMDVNPLKLEEIKHNNRLLEQRIAREEQFIIDNPDYQEGPAQEITKHGDDRNTALDFNSESGGSVKANNDTYMREMAHDYRAKLDFIIDWTASKTSSANGDVQNMKVIVSKGDKKRTIKINDLTSEKVSDIDAVYDQIMVELNARVENPGDYPNVVSSELLNRASSLQEEMHARAIFHQEGQRLMNEQYHAAYNHIVVNDTGGYGDLVAENKGLDLFKVVNGKRVLKTQAEFEGDFISSNYKTPKYSLSYSVTGGIMQTGFQEAKAREDGAELYRALHREIDAISEDSDGTTQSFPAYNLASWYNDEKQKGVGATTTQWSGGGFDHATTYNQNTGHRQFTDLLDMMKNAVGEDMIVRFGKAENVLEEGERKDEDAGNNGTAQDVLDMVIAKFYNDKGSDKSKDNRLQFDLMYNQNGPVLEGDEEGRRYSVYQMLVDGTTASSLNLEEDALGNDYLSRNGNMLQILIPQGSYDNHADHGKYLHPWQMLMAAGVTPEVTSVKGGVARVSRIGGAEGDKYHATIVYNTYEKGGKWGTAAPVSHIFNNYRPEQFAALQVNLETLLADRAAINEVAESKDNTNNK